MIRKISSLFLVMAMTVVYANTSDILEDICKAISAGSAEKVAAYFAPKVDISFGTASDGKQPKVEAEKLLKDFFTRNPVKSFTIQHRGPKANGNSFVIGQLITTTGSSYRVTIYIKENTGVSTIQELKFEKN